MIQMHNEKVAYQQGYEDGYQQGLKDATDKGVDTKCYEDKYIHCPCCNEFIGYKWEHYPNRLNKSLLEFKYCWNCGQRLNIPQVKE